VLREKRMMTIIDNCGTRVLGRPKHTERINTHVFSFLVLFEELRNMQDGIKSYDYSK